MQWMGSAAYMDRGSGSGRQSVARLLNAIVVNIEGTEFDTVRILYLTSLRARLTDGMCGRQI
jgi:hypothetical protein